MVESYFPQYIYLLIDMSRFYQKFIWITIFLIIFLPLHIEPYIYFDHFDLSYTLLQEYPTFTDCNFCIF